MLHRRYAARCWQATEAPLVTRKRTTRKPSSTAAYLGALFAVVLWGVSFVATKTALRELSPVGLIFTRFGLGVVFLCGVLAFRGERSLPPKASLPTLALLGFVGVFVHQLLQAYGLTLTSASSTGWLIGLIPIWSAILAALFLGERFRAGKIAGLVLGFAGAALAVARAGSLRRGLSLPATQGDLLIIASTVNWAIYTILGRAALGKLGAARTTAGAMFLGWLMLAPFFLGAAGWREWGSVSLAGWGSVLFLGLGCSGLGYLLWYEALAKLEASKVAALIYLEPLVTLGAATALLGEPLQPRMIAGGLVVLAGVLLVQRSNP